MRILPQGSSTSADRPMLYSDYNVGRHFRSSADRPTLYPTKRPSARPLLYPIMDYTDHFSRRILSHLYKRYLFPCPSVTMVRPTFPSEKQIGRASSSKWLSITSTSSQEQLAAMSSCQIVVNDSTGSLIDSWGLSSSPINSKILTYLIAATLFGLVFYSRPKTKSNVPLINPRHLFELTDTRAKQDFIKNSKCMIENQFAKTPNKPFRVISDTGVATVLPPCLADEIRNDPRLNFGGFTKKVKDT